MDKKIEHLPNSKINFMDVNTVYQDDEETVQDLLSNFTDSYDNIVNTVNEIKKVTDNINTNIDKKVETVTSNHKKYIDDHLSNISNDLINDISSYKTNINNKINKHENDTNNELQKIKSDTNRIYDKYKTDIDLNLAIHKNNVNNTINANQQELKNIINTGKEELRADLEDHKEEIINITNEFIDTNKELYENSKIDFYGNEHKTLDNRLNTDFDNVHQRINESELLPYEGCSIKADNTYYGLQKDTVVKGRTLQSVIHGKNMVVDASDNTLRTINLQANLLKTNTDYTFIFNVKENTLTKLLRTLAFDGEFLPTFRRLVSEGETGIIKTVITTTDTRRDTIGLSTDNVSGIALGEQKIVFDLMVLEGNHTQTPLEELPYVEGIESTGDKSKNLFFGAFEEGQINSETGEEIAYNGRCRSVQYANIEPNKTYTVSMVQNVVSAPWTSIRLYKDNTFIKTVQDPHGKAKFTFESGEANRLRVTANIPYNDVINCQIEEGIQATPYQEHYDGYKISGKSIGKNLFVGVNKDTFACDTSNYTLDGKGVIRGIETTWNREMSLKVYHLKPNTTYRYSCSLYDGVIMPNRYQIRYYNEKGELIYTWNDNSNSTARNFTTPNIEFEFVKIFFKNQSVTSIEGFYNFQIKEGEAGSPFEEYKESNYSYILNEPLRSLPDGTGDSIDLETGIVTRRVGKVVITHESNIGLNSTGENHTQFVTHNTIFKSNKAKTENLWCDTKPVKCENAGNNSFWIYAGDTGVFQMPSSVNTKELMKEWLKSNPTTVYYELATPTTEQLTPCQLKSFDTTTHIISENKLMPIVSTKIPSNMQAIISTLRLENSELKNNVEVLSVENEELKETINVQDSLIDTSLCATDELYNMVENLLPEVIE